MDDRNDDEDEEEENQLDDQAVEMDPFDVWVDFHAGEFDDTGVDIEIDSIGVDARDIAMQGNMPLFGEEEDEEVHVPLDLMGDPHFLLPLQHECSLDEIGKCLADSSCYCDYRAAMVRLLRSLVDVSYSLESLEACGQVWPLDDKPLLDMIAESHGLKSCLEQETKSTEQCGRMFVSSDVIYQCLDCAIDPTCVFCAPCFLHSEHRQHRYRISQSDGGGFCDCGDEEAWTSFPNCSLHEPEEDDSIKIPINDRHCILLARLIQFCSEMLFCKEFYALRSPNDQHFASVLYNDEIHSFNEITKLMVDCCERTRAQGYEIAQVVDELGRGIIGRGSFDQCNHLIDTIADKVTQHRMANVLVRTTHERFLKSHKFCLRILDMIEQMLRKSKRAKAVECEIEPTSANAQASTPAITGSVPKTVLSTIFPECDRLWKEARAVFMRIFVVNLLDSRWKELIARYYIQNYCSMWSHYINVFDDNNCSADLSVQFLTTPSLSLCALRDHSALRVIVDCIVQKMSNMFQSVALNAGRKPTLAFSPTQSYRTMTGRKCLKMLHDVRHILQSVLNALKIIDDEDARSEVIGTITSPLRQGLCSLMNFMAMFEETGSFRRQIGDHLERDYEWETAFVFSIRIFAILRFLYPLFNQRLQLISQLTRSVIENMSELLPDLIDEPLVERSIAGVVVDVIDCEVLKSRQSAHHPLFRFLTGILIHLVGWTDVEERANAEISQFQRAINTFTTNYKFRLVRLMEHALSTQVFIAQLTLNLWIRNGHSPLNSYHQLASIQCCTEMSDRDLQALQIVASQLHPNKFTAHLLNRYELQPFILLANDLNDMSVDRTGFTFKQMVALTENYFDLILKIVTGRYNEHVARIEPEQILKLIVIHALCVKSATHNQLVRKLDECMSEVYESNPEILEDILENVANSSERQQSDSTAIIYSIKEQLVADSHFNPYFHRYNVEKRSERNEAEHNRFAWRQSQKLPRFLKIPKLAEFRSAFSSIPNILVSDTNVQMYAQVLRLSARAHHPLSSEGQLKRVLDLIALSIELVPPLPHLNNNPLLDNSKEFVLLIDRLIHSNHGMRDHLSYVRSLLTTEVDSQTEVDSHDLAEDEFKKRAKLQKEKMMAVMLEKQRKFAQSHEQALLGVQQADASDAPHTCIICQDKQSFDLKNSRSLGLLCYIQRSNVLMNASSHDEAPTGRSMASLAEFGVHVSSCGHLVHMECCQAYVQSLRSRNEINANLIHLFYDRTQNEFPCPLCRAINNCILLMLPPMKGCCEEQEDASAPVIGSDFDEWIERVNQTIHSNYVQEEDEEDEIKRLRSRYPLEKPVKDVQQEEKKPSFDSVMRWMFSVDGGSNSGSSEGQRDEKREEFSVPEEAQRSMLYFSDVIKKFYCESLSNLSTHRLWPLFSTSIYSLACHQHFLIVCNKNIYDEQQIPASTNLLLSQLCQFLVYYTLVMKDSKLCFQQAYSFLLGDESSRRRVQGSVSELDTLNALFCLVCSWLSYIREESELFSTNIGHYFAHFVKFALARHCINIIKYMSPYWSTSSSIDRDYEQPNHEDDDKNQFEHFAMLTFKHLLSNRSYFHNSSPTSTQPPAANELQTSFSDLKSIRLALQKESVPFLRLLCYLKRFLLNTPFPCDLVNSFNFEREEIEASIRYLRLNEEKAFDAWALLFTHSNLDEQPFYPDYLSTSLNNKVHLVSLPNEYVTLLTPSSTMSGGGGGRQIYLCLVCGEIINASTRSEHYRNIFSYHRDAMTFSLDEPTSYFEDAHGRMVAGEACRHVAKCSSRSGCGCLLKVMDCIVLMLQIISRHPLKVRGAKLSAPYVNKFGEPDDLLRRGEKLTFSYENYEKLKRMWIGHQVPQVTSKYGQTLHQTYEFRWENL